MEILLNFGGRTRTRLKITIGRHRSRPISNTTQFERSQARSEMKSNAKKCSFLIEKLFSPFLFQIEIKFGRKKSIQECKLTTKKRQTKQNRRSSFVCVRVREKIQNGSKTTAVHHHRPFDCHEIIVGAIMFAFGQCKYKHPFQYNYYYA